MTSRRNLSAKWRKYKGVTGLKELKSKNPLYAKAVLELIGQDVPSFLRMLPYLDTELSMVEVGQKLNITPVRVGQLYRKLNLRLEKYLVLFNDKELPLCDRNGLFLNYPMVKGFLKGIEY